MAIVEWKPKAWLLYNDLLEDARMEFGAKTARRWENEFVHFYGTTLYTHLGSWQIL